MGCIVDHATKRLTRDVRVIAHDGAIVAESPMWSVAEQALCWLDGRRDAVYRFDTRSGARAQWPTPSKVNGLALSSNGLVLAMKSGIALLDTSSGLIEHIADPEPGNGSMRMNDAKLDRAGRLWFGSMEDNGALPAGRIFRLSPNLALEVVDEGFTVPNGFAWSPDNRRMFVADSRLGTIYAYDFDLESGRAWNRRPFIATPPKGAPDGATTDARGYLWSACVGGSAIACYAPDATVECIIELPVERPTSVIFGGPDLKTLYITTATRGLSFEQRTAQPLAGAILAVDLDITGLPEPTFIRAYDDTAS